MTARKATTRKVTLQTHLSKLGIATSDVTAVREFLMGRKLLTRSNASSGHQYGIGTKLKVDEACTINVNSISGLFNPKTGFGGNTIYFTELELLPGDISSLKSEIKEIDKRISELKSEQTEVNEQITFLEETGAEELDEPKYKKWVLKKVFSSKMTEDEKISKLAELLFD